MGEAARRWSLLKLAARGRGQCLSYFLLVASGGLAGILPRVGLALLGAACSEAREADGCSLSHWPTFISPQRCWGS